MDISLRTYVDLENGVKELKLSQVENILDALDCRLEDLLNIPFKNEKPPSIPKIVPINSVENRLNRLELELNSLKAEMNDNESLRGNY